MTKKACKHKSRKSKSIKAGKSLWETFVIPCETAEAGGPGKGALHNPALGKEDEAPLGLFEFDNNELGRYPKVCF